MARAAGGWLQQEADSLAPEDIEFTVVSEKQVRCKCMSSPCVTPRLVVKRRQLQSEVFANVEHRLVYLFHVMRLRSLVMVRYSLGHGIVVYRVCNYRIT